MSFRFTFPKAVQFSKLFLKKGRAILLLLLMYVQPVGQATAQTFRFSDTYQTNNVDSLENWLKTHPQPTQERLKNLIRLNRTYPFTYPEKKNRDTTDIRQLAQRLNHPLGKSLAAVWVKSDFKNALQLLEDCEISKDTSGMIAALTRLVNINYTIAHRNKGDQYAAQDYLLRARQLLKARFDMHDFIAVESAAYYYQALKPGTNQDSLLQSYQNTLKYIESHPQCKYAWTAFKGYIAVIHYYRGEYAASYAINKEILTQLKPDQFYLTAVYTQNLINDCGSLNRYDEKLALCQKLSTLIRVFPQKNFPYNYQGLYNSFKNELSRRGRYQEAMLYADSMLSIKDTIYNIERNQKLIEFQAENKQKQIAELSLRQTQIENRNRFILTLLGIAVLVAAALTYLGVRLRQSNARLNALVQLRDEFIRIIAHDLRRPLHAFYGLSEVFSKLLQRGDQQSIIKLSRSIDQSGLYIRQMLDNLMYWALSQKGSLMPNFTTFALRPLLEDLLSVYGTVAALKGVNLTLTCPADLAVYTDSNALNLILRNLIDNATQHTPAQGSVSVELIPVTESNEVHILISDTGKGLTDTQLQLVREVLATPQRFQPKQDNLGLGLIIVSTFAKQAKISIGVESKEGNSTTFLLRLPKED